MQPLEDEMPALKAPAMRPPLNRPKLEEKYSGVGIKAVAATLPFRGASKNLEFAPAALRAKTTDGRAN